MEQGSPSFDHLLFVLTSSPHPPFSVSFITMNSLDFNNLDTSYCWSPFLVSLFLLSLFHLYYDFVCLLIYVVYIRGCILCLVDEHSSVSWCVCIWGEGWRDRKRSFSGPQQLFPSLIYQKVCMLGPKDCSRIPNLNPCQNHLREFV